MRVQVPTKYESIAHHVHNTIWTPLLGETLELGGRKMTMTMINTLWPSPEEKAQLNKARHHKTGDETLL